MHPPALVVGRLGSRGVWKGVAVTARTDVRSRYIYIVKDINDYTVVWSGAQPASFSQLSVPCPLAAARSALSNGHTFGFGFGNEICVCIVTLCLKDKRFTGLFVLLLSVVPWQERLHIN